MPRRTQKNSTVEVIVLKADKHLWEKYEVVRVKPIFAKNVLLPKGIVVLATAWNLNTYLQKMEAAKEQRAKKATGFNDMLDKVIQAGGLTFEKKANDRGSLYSKLDAKEISEKLESEFSVKVPDHLIKMKKKIQAAGDFKVPFKYKEIERDIPVTVKAIIEKKAKTEALYGTAEAKAILEAEAEAKAAAEAPKTDEATTEEAKA